MRKVACLVLFNSNKQVLLQHRTKEAKRLPDYWALFGGGIEEGENVEKALERELLEELEYKVTRPVLISDDEYDGWNGERTRKYTFIEKFDDSQKLVQHEGQGMGWFDFDELVKLKISDRDREVLGKIQKYLKA